jgi:excinuclease ABC subunit B
MRAAAADLEFETAARLRDEIKRLKMTEMAVFDEPSGRQGGITAKAGKGAASQYGAAANLPPTRAKKPSLDSMGPGTDREVPLSGSPRSKGGGKPTRRR